ncbi:hypothetical protein FALCPG4_007284 [Fusarium falciforme]
MRAIVQLGQAYNVTIIDLPVPTLVDPTDAIVKINASAICSTDLHTFHMGIGSQDQPYLLGHKAIWHIIEVGNAIKHVSMGDYMVIPDVIDDGRYSFDYMVPRSYGGLQGETIRGLQAKYARVPFGDESLILVPINSSTDADTLYNYLMVSDIFVTA